MKVPKISIIIPVYNVEKYLRRCIDSCISQTMQEIEIILVNDASPDNSHIIMKQYETAYPDKIKCIYLKKNIRQGGARNRALEIAQGEFVLFVDSDDWIDETMCEELYEKAKEKNADIVYCDVLRETVSGYCISSRFDDTLTGIVDAQKIKELTLQLYVGPCAHLIKKDIIILNQLFFPEGVFSEDTAITRIWDIHAKCIEKVSKPLYTYCLNLESVGQKKWTEYRTDDFLCIKLLYDNLSNCLMTKDLQQEREVICLNYILPVINRLMRNHGENYIEQIDADVKKCINHIYKAGVLKNPYWDFWFTLSEQQYFLGEVDLKTYLNNRGSSEDFYGYYLKLKQYIEEVFLWLEKHGKTRIAIWSKTNYANGFSKAFDGGVIVDSMEEIEKYDVEVLCCLRSNHMQNIKHIILHYDIAVFNFQGYLLNDKIIDKYYWENNGDKNEEN